MPKITLRAVIVVPALVTLVLLAFFTLGYLLTLVFLIPMRINFPLPIRLVGLVVVALGFIFLGWLFKYRRPSDILTSTYVTFSKAAVKAPLEERQVRTEPLVVSGPYRYVRHPLYSGVLLLLLGWWLLLDYTFLGASIPFLLLWFNFVVGPFEEKELRAIFGDAYEQYAKNVPRIIPLLQRIRNAPENRAARKSAG
jgi:protein-S-isoprenylcysteine O-methyltransferase Ste14